MHEKGSDMRYSISSAGSSFGQAILDVILLTIQLIYNGCSKPVYFT